MEVCRAGLQFEKSFKRSDVEDQLNRVSPYFCNKAIPMRIVFMGTPDFAVEIIRSIEQSKHEIVGYVTVPDKPAGRGRKINESAVKQYVKNQNIPLFQPEKLKSEAFLTELEQCKADLFVVVAFRMLPKQVWNLPPRGTINLHGSLLPNYRGAAPINWAVINGDEVTGVSTFYIEEEIDTGNILLQEQLSIGINETAGEVHDRMAQLGGKVVVDTLNGIESETLTAIPQSNFKDSARNPAPKIFRQDCAINWEQPVQQVHNFIRGLTPFPGAHTLLKKADGSVVQFKLSDTRVTDEDAGSIQPSAEGILFPCLDKSLLVRQIQMQGKRKMHFKDFLAGNDISEFKIQSKS